MEDVIFSSDFIKIVKKEKEFFLESYKKGMDLQSFNKILSKLPYIKITNFVTVRNAIQNPPLTSTKFGELKERIQVEVSADELKAFITLSVMDIELAGEAKTQLIKEILDTLRKNGIVYGVIQTALINELANGVKVLIAEGDPPENGQDSIVKLYELQDIKPEIKEDGNVDHYELSLINKVAKGDWLGERVDATEGTAGKSVKGNMIAPMAGKTYPLYYDKESIEEVYGNGVTTLRALRSGAVHYNCDRISVSNHLEIEGDIDFRTGNIDFDGFLTVRGSIADNFSICANKDIEIRGDYGVGSVKEIESRDGNVFIKGGIAGKNKAIVRSKKNIYTKFVSDATIICEGLVHIGFYCLNSNITAKEVIIDSNKGQIIGGNISAEIKVVSSTIGTPAEKRTVVSVSGFDRNALKARFDRITEESNDLRNQVYKLKQEVSIYANTLSSELNKKQMDEYTSVKDRFLKLKENLVNAESEKKILASYLRTHGDGQISILKKAYPNTVVEIKRISRELNKVILNTTFYYSDGEIKQL